MDWMYKGISGHVDREEYLTGRKIDKTFEIIEKEENPNAAKSDDEGALINQLSTKNFFENFSKSDLSAKMREDPLFAIKMKQQEQRKEILHNPVKLKHLQELLKTSLKKDKKHKKDKKKSKRKHKSKKSKNSLSRSPERTRKYSTSESSSDLSDSESSNHRHRSNRNKLDSHSLKDKYHHKESSYRWRKTSESMSSRHKQKSHTSTIRGERSSFYDRKKAQIRPKLSEEEIEKRRLEMMSNALRRDKDRAEIVKKLNEREKEEDQLTQSASLSGAKFIKPMLSNIASSTSIQDSIRQKRYTSQKGPGSMESNFARLN